MGLQEIRRWPSQARWITRHLNQSLGGELPYQCHLTAKMGLWGLWEGIAVLTSLPIVEQGSLDLHGQHRVANWVRVRLADGQHLEIHHAHLAAGDPVARDRQANLIMDHMAGGDDIPKVLVGDLNAGPTSSTLRVLGERLRSAHALAHGEDPAKTWPTPLRPGVGTGCVIDYVLVDDHVEVLDARLTFDRAGPTDPTLFASDHFGIAATVTVHAKRVGHRGSDG